MPAPVMRHEVADACRSAFAYLASALGIDMSAAAIDGLVDLVLEDIHMYMSAAAVMADFTQPVGSAAAHA